MISEENDKMEVHSPEFITSSELTNLALTAKLQLFTIYSKLFYSPLAYHSLF